MTRPPYDPATDSSHGDTPFDHPAFVRLEYWDPKRQHWKVGHAGISLLHPRRYVERLAVKGKVGRVIIVDTGEVLEADLPPCPHCEEPHPEPHNGTCLL